MKATTELDILSLFVTVIALFDVPDAVLLNAQLRRVIEQRERTHPAGRVRSNLGGWQSSDDMETWGGSHQAAGICAKRREPHDNRSRGKSGPRTAP